MFKLQLPPHRLPPIVNPAYPFLPLSWGLSLHNTLQLHHVPLRFSRQKWITYANIPPQIQRHQLPRLLSRGHRAFVLRGCSPLVCESLLQDLGGEILPVGQEALLDLQGTHFQRVSIRQLVRRGLRHGRVQPMALAPPSPAAQALWNKVYGHYPAPLQHLFRSRIEEAQRAFGLISPSGQCLGLITLTQTAADAWHTELLLRDPEARVGVMEALLAETAAILAETAGARWLSLGEVPFVAPPPGNLRARTLRWVGLALASAYPAPGLHRFKDKFRPLWRPVYLYGYPNLPWRSLLGLFIACGCHHLAWRWLHQRLPAFLRQHRPG